MALNLNQKLALAGVVLGAFALGGAQLNDIFGAGVSKIVVSACVLANTIVNGILAQFTGNANVVKDASNVTGVEPIKLNKDAPPAIAALAFSDNVPNVEASSSKVEIALEKKLNGDHA